MKAVATQDGGRVFTAEGRERIGKELAMASTLAVIAYPEAQHRPGEVAAALARMQKGAS